MNIDKDIVKLWKFIGKNAKIYDNELKTYIQVLNIGAVSKMQIPINEKSSLNLIHGFLTFQIYLNSTKSFTIEIAISDNNYGKKRILLSACSKEFIINQMHCRIPIINIPVKSHSTCGMKTQHLHHERHTKMMNTWVAQKQQLATFFQ